MPKFNPNRSRLNMWIDAFVLFYSLSCFTVGFLVTLYCLFDPRAAVFLGALIPLQYYSYLIMAIIATLFHGYMMIVLELSVALTGSIVIFILWYLTVILTKELRLGRTSYKTLNTLREQDNLRIIYRSFQILNENAMCFIGPYITMFHCLFVLFPALCNFLLIRYWHDLDLLCKLPLLTGCFLVTGFWLLVLQLGKYLWVRGNRILTSWSRTSWSGSNTEMKIMRKFTKSCRPILIFHGKQLVVGRMTQFFYFKAVTRGTFRALLTTNN